MIIALLVLILLAILFPGLLRAAFVCVALVVLFAIGSAHRAGADEQKIIGRWILQTGEDPIHDERMAMIGASAIDGDITIAVKCWSDWANNIYLIVPTEIAYSSAPADAGEFTYRFDKRPLGTIALNPSNDDGRLRLSSDESTMTDVQEFIRQATTKSKNLYVAFNGRFYTLPANGLMQAANRMISYCGAGRISPPVPAQ